MPQAQTSVLRSTFPLLSSSRRLPLILSLSGRQLHSAFLELLRDSASLKLFTLLNIFGQPQPPLNFSPLSAKLT